jgi:hypothetical protein
MVLLRRHIRVGLATALVLAAVTLCAPSAMADAGGGPDVSAAPADVAADSKPPAEASLEQQFEAPEEVRVGDRLELSLQITHPTDTSVLLPETFGNPRWELVDTDRDSADDETRTLTTLTLTFQIFRPGHTTLPAFVVTILDGDDETVELESEPVEAKVVSVLPADETPEMKSHRHPVAVWTDDYTLAWVGGILFGAVLAAALTWLIARRREDDEVGPPPRPAHIVALEKLSALTTGELLDAGEYMVFYVRMSGAVREYLGRRYGFRGTELTTTEILDHLEEVDWPAGLSLVDVRQWLEHCDLIKFSGVRPRRERAQQALRRGFSIVELTRPIEEPQTEGPDEAEAPDEEPEASEEKPEAPTEPEASDEEPEASDEEPEASDEEPAQGPNGPPADQTEPDEPELEPAGGKS